MSEKYEIGYGKPPKSSQFQSGQSGNKKGRPKGSKNVYTLLNEILSQTIPVREGDKTIKISKKVAMLMQLTNEAIKGNIKAMSVLLPYILAADIKAEEKDKVLEVLKYDDEKIISNYLKVISNSEDTNIGEKNNDN